MRDLLPPFELLSKEQDEAIRSAADKSMLVTGPPGSGKTVIAVFRAAELRKQGKNVDIIVFGNVLFSYLKKSLNALRVPVNVRTDTYHKWIRAYIKRRFSKWAPTLGDPFTYDWDQIARWHKERDFKPEFSQLIVDEAQDLPVDFLRIAPYISDAVTVFADENQKIFDTSSTLSDIRNALRRFSPREIRLRLNYRNSRAIANLAAHFCTNGIETGVGLLPDDRESGELPELCRYKDEAGQIQRIITYAKNHPDHQVGVFLFSKSEVKRWSEAISNGYRGAVQRYCWQKGQDNTPPDFSRPGIFVVTYHSAKGLEFEGVFLPQMEKLPTSSGDTLRMLLYVVLSRARESLVLMYAGDTLPTVLSEALTEVPGGFHQLVSYRDEVGSSLVVDGVLEELSKHVLDGSLARAESTIRENCAGRRVVPRDEIVGLLRRVLTADQLKRLLDGLTRPGGSVARKAAGTDEWRIGSVLDALEERLSENLFDQVFDVIRARYKDEDIVRKSEVRELLTNRLRTRLALSALKVLDGK